MFDISNFYCAENIANAIDLLKNNPEAHLINGGTDILIKIRSRQIKACKLISIRGLEELECINLQTDGSIRIGAGTPFCEIVNNHIVRDNLPALSEAADMVGSPEIRNVATIGGNLCNGAVSADSAAILLAMNALLETHGANGTRMLSIHEFYSGPGKTFLPADEILAAVLIRPEDYENFGACYLKYGKRNAMEIATLGCAINLQLSEDKTKISDLRIAYTVAGPTPLRCRETEKRITGARLDEKLLTLTADSAVRELSPRDSWRSSRDLRLNVAGEFAKRAMAKAILRAGGTIHA